MDSFKSKKIGIFSDIHIGHGQDNAMWHESVLDFGKWAADKFENLGINEIAIPGDIFHNRSEISVKTLDVAKQFFDIFREFSLVISTGNHDCYKKMDSEIHSLSLLKEWRNITIVDDAPMIFKTAYDKTVSFIPWATSIDDMPISDIMFAHLDIVSFYQNGYHLCEKGFQTAELFKKSKYIISGHFHKRDHREYTEGTILYSGSPMQFNFGECQDSRGIHIFDLETETFEFIENEVSPRHKRIRVTEIIDKKIKATDLKKMIPNNLICLIVDSPITFNVQSILLSKLQNLGPKYLKVEYELPEVDISVDTTVEYTGTDIAKTLVDYIDEIDTPHKDELKEYLVGVYKGLAI